MFSHDFVREAFIAGTPIALACGLIGWFVVLRAQVFAGDALSHVAFVGAIAAAVAGVDERVGLFAFTLVVALGMASLGGRRGEADDAVIGTVFAWILGIGVLLLAVAFLALLAAVTAESTQAVGALLLLGLLAAPAGAAHLLTTNPYRGLVLSGAIAVAAMWAGLSLAYAVPSLPPSSAIIGFAAASYVGAAAWRLAQRARSTGRPVSMV
jgi:zinc/manganese transport system permease protein